CSGSGGSFLAKAASRGADAYLTGEISYHSGIEAHQRGITVIEVGHFESERIIARPLAVKLNESDLIRESGVKVFYASSDLEPFVGRLDRVCTGISTCPPFRLNGLKNSRLPRNGLSKRGCATHSFIPTSR
ncbi:Nif3-like dinuclear metal center hexameric protein, partial [Candidatus Sumerlaeota bacterium]|nr:Nif3-like dinuclear metal center hexameric protein [Candidatus Sumerlaeota bacterium]